MKILRKAFGSLSRDDRDGYIFVLPWLIGFLLLGVFPIGFSLFLSLNNWNIVQKMEWVGLRNFVQLFDTTRTTGQEFYKSLEVTFYYTFLSIPLRVIWAITIALLLHRIRIGQRFLVSWFYLPSVISGVSMALMWKWIFNTRSGLANALLKSIGITGPNWFLETSTAIPAFVLMSLWDVGLMMVVYLGALRNIPPEIEESVELDGAGPVRKLFRIILPMISPVILYQIVMGVIGSFQVFVPAYVMSGSSEAGGGSLGGPSNAYLFYVLNIYKYGFVYLRMGFASALAWVLFIIILVFTLMVIKTSPFWTFYRGEDGD